MLQKVKDNVRIIRARNLRSCWRQQFKKNIQLFALSNQNWKSNFKFPYTKFPYIRFSKGKEFNNEFYDPHSDDSLFFYIICTREAKKQAKMWFYRKAFSYKVGVLF